MKITCTKKEKSILIEVGIERICDRMDDCPEGRPISCAECFEKYFNIEWDIVNE